MSGNALITTGGKVYSTSSRKKATRPLNKEDSGTVWVSVLVKGTDSSAKVDLSLAEKVFMGQGSESGSSKHWTVRDSKGEIVSPNETGGATSFLVMKYNLSDKKVWFWVDPLLDTTPDDTDSLGPDGGEGVNEGEFDKVGLYFDNSGVGAIDEIRIGDSYGDVVAYTSAPKNDTTITAPASVDFGGMLVGYDPAAKNVNLTKTGSDETTYTATRANNGVTVTADGVIAGGGQTETISIDFNDNANGSGTAGAKSIAVTIDNTAATSDGAGKGSADIDDVINVTATVYQAADVTGNTGSVLDDGDTLTLDNADNGALRSEAFVTDVDVTGDPWSLGSVAVGNNAAAGSGLSGAVSFDQSGLLNGQTLAGGIDITLENNPAYAGATNDDLGERSWTLSHDVSGNVGDGSAVVASGGSLVGLNGVSDEGLGNEATILAGVSSSGGTVSMAWRAGTEDEMSHYPPPGIMPDWAAGLLGDVVNITGIGGDKFVLEMSYDPANIYFEGTPPPDPEQFLIDHGWLFVAWRDTSDGMWKHATLGNSDGGAGALYVDGAWSDDTTLSHWGVDKANDTVWAVLDHNSEFAVLPEPASMALLALGGAVILARRRRR